MEEKRVGVEEEKKERALMKRHAIKRRTEHEQVPLSIPYLHKIIYSVQDVVRNYIVPSASPSTCAERKYLL